ncbi:type II secretion system F family protein [Cereibacter sphaeroides]|uniref:type II secretion system F family protein n=1 Tax=Cereibacter sphaeroides TaxID=1063 RepID=UPI001F3F54AF|nr:type II secretion system F family protein [Cereibacter sphaeroides]MCE6951926.1 type II secretion system F family protein [Cereibacter sphaeroides]MCE6961239.1 type II secretion system F family protein [Cereibacter sphaeroides]MCE6970225.1 type II secretion system F family protein [Cereibacter sphaeroides]MCE6974036.1 type II secretion system F family protein [Cereibacter sphaeroides]
MELLTRIETILTDQLGPLGPLFAVGAVGIILIAAALPSMLKKRVEPFDRIKQQRTAAQAPASQALRRSTGTEKLDRFANLLEPKTAEELSASRLKMLRAGYRSKGAVRAFHASQFALGVGFLVVGVIYAMISSAQQPLSMQQMVSFTLLPGAIGYYLPIYWVKRRAQERHDQIVAGFPDALDMMLVCVEAGQSLDQSILRVARETAGGYPALSEEFEMVAHEVKAGKERVSVLKDMAERVGIPDVSSFVTTLIQSATFGTSIAEALRVYSSEMRDKRVMRAEEKANTLPTKLTLGTMMLTVPPLMLILIGPSVYGIATQLGGQ